MLSAYLPSHSRQIDEGAWCCVYDLLIRLRSHVEEKRHRRRNCAQICDERVGEVRGRHGGDGQSKAFQRHLVKAEHALQKKITEPSILSFIDLSIYL